MISFHACGAWQRAKDLDDCTFCHPEPRRPEHANVGRFEYPHDMVGVARGHCAMFGLKVITQRSRRDCMDR